LVHVFGVDAFLLLIYSIVKTCLKIKYNVKNKKPKQATQQASRDVFISNSQTDSFLYISFL